MAYLIAVCNQKGGVGKTTTAINLSSGLAMAGKKTLLVDLDPQGNAGSGLGINKYDVERSIYHVLIGRDEIRTIIRGTDVDNLSVCPSNADLVAAELELVGLVSRETRLKHGLEAIENDYEVIIIDCPPSLGLLTLNALTAAKHAIIPVQAEYYAMEGIADLLRTIQLVKKLLNPYLEILGVLLTMFNRRSNLAKQVADELAAHFGAQLFQTVIPRSVRLSEAPSHGKPISLYDKKSVGADRYKALTHEVWSRLPEARPPREADTNVAEPRIIEEGIVCNSARP